ncbi:MAG: NAD(P)/FAD-dependent oxidoreductase [Betaproteobacteria bacterium]|nr:MAG: NAD(P)/FAD-dependent oxidoreductase [Betaproteobacteria bacterium]
MTSRYDVVVVGAGHNGLVCAGYLARAGLKVKVLERRSVVGGAAVTEEFHPGFRNSAAAYTVSLLQRKVMRELRLAEHGLRIVERPLANFLPLDGGEYLKVGGGRAATQQEVAKFSTRDAERLPRYWRRLETLADVLRGLVLETPPNAGGGFSDLLRLLKSGNRLRQLDREAQRDLLEIFTSSAAQFLERFFESDGIQAAFGFDAVVGNFASPFHPGTAYVLLHHCFGEVNGQRGAWGHAIGGMGAISEALAAEARRLGAEIECDAPVARIRPGEVALEGGTVVACRAIAANVNPKLLYLKLMEPGLLAPQLRARMEHYKCGSATFRINVALTGLPRFACLPEPGAHHGAGIILAPSLAYMDRAYLDARAAGIARQPIVEMVIPSTLDDSLAPAGRHVASLFCQHFAPDADWGARKDEAIGRILDVIEAQAPGFRQLVIGHSALSPADLERDFGLVGGDIFHGALTLDQLWAARPLLGYADYRTPLKGVYLCGSGAHPGGGVTGAPGHNCAREMLRDFGKRMR